MTQNNLDTKAHWKRRALRAERQLEELERIRDFEISHERDSIYRSSVRAVALDEIRDAMAALDQALKVTP